MKGNLTVVVLAQERVVYDQRTYAYTCKDNYNVQIFNERNFKLAMGLQPEAVIYIGKVSDENKAKFNSLIKD